VAPDRWRLFKVRPVSLTVYEKSSGIEGDKVPDLWARPDFVDADGPDGSVLYSIHVAIPSEPPTGAAAIASAEISAEPTIDLGKPKRRPNGDRRYRYEESKYDPVIERAAKEERRHSG
jgi:hypothetical protein